jgi:tetratricopeptide (TPR) repeat protein
VTGERDTPRDGVRTAPIASGPVTIITGPPVLISALQGGRTRLLDYVKELFEGLVSDPAVGSEARVRLGYLHWVTGDEKDALAAERAAADAAKDPDLRYIANVLAAQAAQALNDLPAAEAHYRAALAARPHSQSATLGLAALLYVRGEGRQAYDLVEASRAGRPRDDDPWRLFLYGDFAKLPTLVAELRRLVAQ